MEIPFIDWNGNRIIDSSDIAIGLAIESEKDNNQQNDEIQTGSTDKNKC